MFEARREWLRAGAAVERAGPDATGEQKTFVESLKVKFEVAHASFKRHCTNQERSRPKGETANALYLARRTVSLLTKVVEQNREMLDLMRYQVSLPPPSWLRL